MAYNIILTGSGQSMTVPAGTAITVATDAPSPSPPPSPAPSPTPPPSPPPIPATIPGIIYPQQFSPSGRTLGDFTGDDQPAFQAAFNAACNVTKWGGGVVCIPPPPLAYRWNSGCLIQPNANQSQVRIKVEAFGVYQSIQYFGPNGSSFLRLTGVCDSEFSGLKGIDGPGNLQNVVYWDWFPQSGAGSASGNLLTNCRVQFGTGGGNVAFRLGQNAGFSDCNGFDIRGFGVQGQGAQYKDTAFQIAGGECLGNRFSSCRVSGVGTGFLTGPRLDMGETWTQYTGGSDCVIDNWLGSNNGADGVGGDFLFQAAGINTINGCRLENGWRAVKMGAGANPNLTQLNLRSFGLASYNEPSDGNGVIYLSSTNSLTWHGGFAKQFANAGFKALIKMAYTNSVASLRGVDVQQDAAGDFPVVVGDASNRLEIANCRCSDSQGRFSGWMTNRMM